MTTAADSLKHRAEQLQKAANIAAAMVEYTSGPSQHWPKETIRSAAKQLQDTLELAGFPARVIEDGCPF